MNKKRANAKATRRQLRQAQKRKQRLISTLIWGGLGVGIVAVVAILLVQGSRPAGWETIPVPAGYVTHAGEGTPPGPYPSDPPAGGVHYGTELDAKFYQESDLASLPAYPEGSLVHNLEHGYVIFWYNCAALDEAGCTQLKADIQKVMDESGVSKLIAFPWSSIKEPVVMTSWGKRLRFKTFNAAEAGAFIKANLNKSPEPNAP